MPDRHLLNARRIIGHLGHMLKDPSYLPEDGHREEAHVSRRAIYKHHAPPALWIRLRRSPMFIDGGKTGEMILASH